MAIRKTKIVASLGPATSSEEVLTELIEAGVNVVRINFSHGEAADHAAKVALIRQISKTCQKQVAVLGDLQGPKIRISRFRDGSIELLEGAEFCLDMQLAADAGTQQRVGVTYAKLIDDIVKGDVLLLDDGNLALQVTAVNASEIHTRVSVGGTLSNNKGINKQGGGLSTGALTEKDLQDIVYAAEMDVDFLAVSFVKSEDDIHEARRLLREAGCKAQIVAKIERKEAIDNLDSIIMASDVIMVARGDLGVEIGYPNLPGVQKTAIKRSRERNRAVITATQMMQSMVDNPIPTRAEVLDVANAVMDGSDAVMLSAETAVGKFPVKVIESMHQICIAAEQQGESNPSYEMDTEYGNTEEAIAMAAMHTANQFDAAAIISLTESGRSAKLMSRYNAEIPIFALTRHGASARGMAMYRGIWPVLYDLRENDPVKIDLECVQYLYSRQLINKGDRLIITRGDLSGVQGGTNTMKIIDTRLFPDYAWIN